MSIGPLYLFAFGAIAFYGIMLGGWSSGSKYSFLGAMRGAAQLISYEVSQGLALVGVIMTAQTLSLTGIVNAQKGMWYFVPQFVGFLIFLTRELRRDQPRAVRPDRGRRRAGRRLQHRVRRRALRLLLLRRVPQRAGRLRHRHDRLPRRLAAAVRHPPPGWVDPFVVLFKMSLFTFLFIWVRATLPRLRYDQLMSFGWKVLLPLATLNALVTAILVVVTH